MTTPYLAEAREYKLTWKNLLTTAREIPEYKLLTAKRYVNPRGYEPWEDVANVLAIYCLLGYRLDWRTLRHDFTTKTAVIASGRAARNASPVYWLTAPLLESFLHTDLPDWIGEIEPSIPYGILMLPKGVIKSPDNEDIKYICFEYAKRGMAFEPLQFGRNIIQMSPADADGIAWTTCTDSSILYASSTGLPNNESDWQCGQKHFDSIRRFGEVDETAESQFLRLIDSIVLQTLLVMVIEPLLLTNSVKELRPRSGIGFKHPIAKELPADALWSPNWIGKYYKVPQAEADASSEVEAVRRSYREKRPHFRRGHLRRVAVGPREEQKREWRWIKPVRVKLNANTK